jgi:hypothetical protein
MSSFFSKISKKLLDTGRLCWYILAVGGLFSQGNRASHIESEREKTMFVLPPNTILLICAAIVFAIVGFVIYGFIKGFDKFFPNE